MFRKVRSVCAPNALGQGFGRLVDIASELAGQENEAVGFRGVAAGRNRTREAIEKMKFGFAHDLSRKKARGPAKAYQTSASSL